MRNYQPLEINIELLEDNNTWSRWYQMVWHKKQMCFIGCFIMMLIIGIVLFLIVKN